MSGNAQIHRSNMKKIFRFVTHETGTKIIRYSLRNLTTLMTTITVAQIGTMLDAQQLRLIGPFELLTTVRVAHQMVTVVSRKTTVTVLTVLTSEKLKNQKPKWKLIIMVFAARKF